MLRISRNITIPDKDIEIHAIRSQGSGGQKINKVSTAIHLRFDINASSLPEYYKKRLLAMKDHRISKDGIIVIKAQKYRYREKNKNDALDKLHRIIKASVITRKKRIPTKPSSQIMEKRLDEKSRRGKQKISRRKVSLNND